MSAKQSRWNIDIKLQRQARLKLSKKNIRAFTAALLDSLEPKLIAQQTNEISLVFTSDKKIRSLNKAFRAKDKSTDVLSFPMAARHPAKVVTLGDVVISTDTAKRQAHFYGVPPAEEIARLLIHGILHLLGHDHAGVSKAKAQRMRRIEKSLFKRHAELAAQLISD